MGRHAKASSARLAQGSDLTRGYFSLRSSRAALVALPFLIASLFVSSAPVMAGTVTTHVLQSSFNGSDTPGGSLGLNGELEKSHQIAIDQATGRVYVTDSAHDVVNVFSPSGTYLAQISGASTPDGTFGLSPEHPGNAVAIDNSESPTKGRIYILGAKALYAFSAAGAYLWKISNSEAGQICGATVAPDGSVWISHPNGQNTESDRLLKYDPTGKLLGELNLAAHSSGPCDIAFDPSGESFYVGFFENDGAVAKYSATGDFEAFVQFSAAGQNASPARGFAVDPVAGDLYVATLLSGAETSVLSFSPSGTPIDSVGGSLYTQDNARSIAVNGTTGDLYVANRVSGEVDIFATETAAIPDAALAPPTGATESSIILNGTVNPQGKQTSWHFEYRLPGAKRWKATSPQSAGSGGSAVPVSAGIEGLEYGTLYEVRLIAVHTETEKLVAAEGSAVTEGKAPIAATLPAAPRTATSARLNARISPEGAATTYYFEYGIDSTYGTSVPVSQDADGGTVKGLKVVAQEVPNLQPETTYHYRVVAKNSIDATEGQDRTFTTRSLAEMAIPARGIELVNSPNKGNNAIGHFSPLPRTISPDGNRATWSIAAGSPDATTGSGATFLATRTSAGWHSTSIIPQAAKQVGGGNRIYRLWFSSSDLSHFLFVAAEGFLTQSSYALIRTDDQQQQEVLQELPATEEEIKGIGATRGASGLNGIFYWRPFDKQIYDASSGSPVRVSILPNGQPPSCGVPLDVLNSNIGFYNQGYDFNSNDGSHVYFLSKGTSCAASVPLKLYLRNQDTGLTTTVTPDPPSGGGNGQNATFVRANSSGTSALFTTSAKQSADDSNTTTDLYRFDETGGNLCLTCSTPSGAAAAVVTSHSGADVLASDDLSYVYFTSSNVLVPGEGMQDAKNRYLWHDGQISYIGTFDSPDLNLTWAAVTPNGRTLVFAAVDPWAAGGTADDIAGGTVQVYRYDSTDGSLTCISCVAIGSTVNSIGGDGGNAGAFVVSNDGNTIAFRTRSRLVDADVNGAVDVYEWHNDRIRLITDGVTEFPSGDGQPAVYGISNSGSDIMFTVAMPMTGFEQDGLSNLYDARIGGGFAPTSSLAACSEDSCQGPLQEPPRFAGAGSSSFSASRKHPAARNRKHKHHKTRKGHRASQNRQHHQRNDKTRVMHKRQGGAK